MTDGTPDNSTPGTPGSRTAGGSSSGGRMSTSEMLELVAADALGLLDDDDRAAFDRAYADAPAAVRELVWAEQARVAEAGLELPDVNADPAVREKFLAAVRDELAKAHAAPSASLGAAAVPAAPAAANPSSRTVAHGSSTLSGGRSAAAVPATPRNIGLRRARRVSAFWRVATVGASVAAVALAVLQVQLRQDFEQLQDRSEIASLIDAIGIEHVDDALFGDADVQRVYFEPVAAVGRAKASLVRNADRGTTRLYIRNLQSRTQFTLVTVDANNTPTGEVASFETDDLLTGVDVDLPGAPGETIRVAIMSAEGEPQVLFVAEFQLA